MTGDTGIDPAACDRALVEALCERVADVPGDVDEVVRRHVPAVAPLADAGTRERLVTAAVARLAGLDAIDDLLSDPDVDEILVNRGGDVWIDRAGELHRAAPLAAGTVATVLERVLAPLGRRLDRNAPMVDARLPDGSRVCAVIPPVAVDGATMSIRRFRQRSLPLDAFAGPTTVELLHELLRRRCNVLVVGATSSGKTSLLGALLASTSPGERVVLIEDTAELDPPVEHLVRLEARAATVDGVTAIGIDQLLRTALRLRPDRLVVGEVRGSEVLTLVQAMNTGHDGSMSTCHANGSIDALHRLETLVLQAAPTWPLAAIRAHLSRSLDAIVHVERSGTVRRIVEIAEVVECIDGSSPGVRPLDIEGQAIAPPQRSRIGGQRC